MHPIFERLKQRKIVQWALAYAAGAGVLYSTLDGPLRIWGITDGQLKIVQVLLVVGFFVALTIAWYHGERGEQRVTGVELLILAGIMGLGAIGLRLVSTGPVSSSGQADSTAVVARFALDFPPAHDHGIDISPDGTVIVIGEAHGLGQGQIRLWKRRLDDLAVTPIPDSEGTEVYSPAISPDGSELAYHADGEIRVAPLDGGVTRVVAEGNGAPIWGPDGLIYFVRDDDDGPGVYRVPQLGGTADKVFEGAGDDIAFQDFTPLPGTRLAIFASVDRESQSTIYAVDLSTGERRWLANGARPRLTGSGRLLFGTDDGQLWAAPFDTRRARLEGPAVPVVQGLAVYRTLALPSYDISQTGTLVYVEEGAGPLSRAEFVWVDRDGRVAVIDENHLFDASSVQGWQLSPDGQSVAYGTVVGGIREVWTKGLPDGPASLIAGGVDASFRPFWSPDGEWITYFSGPTTDQRHVWRRRSDGSGDPQLLYQGDRGFAQGQWSPDGTWLLLRTAANAPNVGDRDVMALQIGSETDPQPLVATGAAENAPALSPDGNWLAYVSDESGQPEVFIRPFPEVDQQKIQVSTAGGLKAVWANRGDEIFYVTPGREMVSARFVRGAITSRSTLFTLPPGMIVAAGAGLDFFDISADDQRFLMARARVRDDDEDLRVVVVQNFGLELDRLVPN